MLHHVSSGRSAAAACAAALRETAELADDFRAPVQALCLLPDGSHGGAATREGATYAVLTAEDNEVRIMERVVA